MWAALAQHGAKLLLLVMLLEAWTYHLCTCLHTFSAGGMGEQRWGPLCGAMLSVRVSHVCGMVGLVADTCNFV
jgi:hypothetical protein